MWLFVMIILMAICLLQFRSKWSCRQSWHWEVAYFDARYYSDYKSNRHYSVCSRWLHYDVHLPAQCLRWWLLAICWSNNTISSKSTTLFFVSCYLVHCTVSTFDALWIVVSYLLENWCVKLALRLINKTDVAVSSCNLMYNAPCPWGSMLTHVSKANTTCFNQNQLQ